MNGNPEGGNLEKMIGATVNYLLWAILGMVMYMVYNRGGPIEMLKSI